MASLFTRAFSWLRPSPRKRTTRSQARARLGLESLEGRSLPSVTALSTSPRQVEDAAHHREMEPQQRMQVEINHQEHGAEVQVRQQGGVRSAAQVQPQDDKGKDVRADDHGNDRQEDRRQDRRVDDHGNDRQANRPQAQRVDDRGIDLRPDDKGKDARVDDHGVDA